jgi:predicted nucleic acid-binding protein
VNVFVDTSALYALLDEDDANHARAARAFAELQGSDLTTHAYVLVETVALVSKRLGWDAVVRLLGGLLSVVEVGPIDASIHNDALADYRNAGPSSVSFVDRTSFSYMRVRRISGAFAFDAQFEAAGFELVG